MSNEKDIEKLFQEKFKNFSPNPPSELWDKISADLPQSSPKKGFWLFSSVFGKGLIAVILVGLVSTPILMLLDDGSKKFATNNKSLSSDTENVEKRKLNSESDKSSFLAENKVNSNSENQSSQLTEGKKINDEINSTLTQEDSKNDKEVSESQNFNSGNSLNKSIKQTQPNDKKNSINPALADTSNSENVLIRNNAAEFPLVAQIISNENVLEPIEKLSFKTWQKQSKISHLVGDTMPESALKNKPKLRYFIDAYAGPSMAYRRFNSNHNLMLSHKQQAESILLSYDFGVNFGVSLKKWEISIGAQIERLGEKYNYSAMKEVHDTSITWHQHPQNPNIMVADTSVQVHHNKVEHNTQNIYNYLSIPVNVGYKFNVSPRFKVIPTFTTGINVLLNANASWLDPVSLNPVVHSSNDGTNAYRKINFSSRLQIGLYYALTEKLYFMAKPEAATLWQSVFINDDFLNHRPFAFEANFGLRYTFN